MINVLKFLPLTVFIVYARLNGMTDVAWREAFILGGICTLIVVAVQLYKKVTFDRLMLGVNLFLLVGAVAFLGELYGILMLYGTYKGAALLACVGIVGLMTTLFTDARFIGVDVVGKTALKKRYSFMLLLVTMLAFVWAVMMNQQGLVVSAIVPFIILRVMYEEFGKKLEFNNN